MLVDKSKFKPIVVTCHDKILENKEKQKYWYGKAARKAVEKFSEGQLVYVQDKFNKQWSQSKILKRLPEPRSFLVKLKGGNTLKRNVQWLKDRKQNDYEDTETGFD